MALCRLDGIPLTAEPFPMPREDPRRVRRESRRNLGIQRRISDSYDPPLYNNSSFRALKKKARYYGK